MNREVFLSLLALDAYNRGYGRGVFANGSATDENESCQKIGNATVLTDANDPEGVAKSADFYAIAYDWKGETVISYRRTDNLAPDAVTGYLTRAGYESMEGLHHD